MAPQVPQVIPTPTVQLSILSTSAPSNASSKPWVPIPVALSIFLGVCLAYVVSYMLYRIVMSRRRESPENIPDSPDRGVSQFMNGARLTLNLSNAKSIPLTLDEPTRVPDGEKPLTDLPCHVPLEISTSIPEDSSTPFIVSIPSFTALTDDELGGAQPQPCLTRHESKLPITTPVPAQQPSAVIAKILSRDRVEAIALDPKLAPVQGPVRPLSMVQSPTRKKWTTSTLFGLGSRHPRGHGGDSEKESERR